MEKIRYSANGYGITVYKQEQPRITTAIYKCGNIETTSAYRAQLWREQGLKVIKISHTF